MIRTASIASLTLVAALSVGLKPAAAFIDEDVRWGASVPHLAVPIDSPAQPPKAAKKHPRPSDSKAARKADAPVKTSGPMHIVVSLAKQRVTLYADGHPVASSPASTGMPGHPTPVGVFSVIQKDRHHFSNIYGAAMPYMQRITWSGSALHEGPLPGHPASHGCIRLTSSFAQLLWKTTKIGVRVIVTRDDVTPVEISMANPFAPKPKMVDGPALTTLIKTADATGSVTPGIVTAAPEQPAETTSEPPAANESAAAASDVASATEAASATKEAAKAVQAPVAEGAADVTPRPVADVVPKPDTEAVATPAPADRADSSTANDFANRVPMIEPAPVSFDGMRPAEPAKPVTDERPAATEVVPLPIPAPGLRNAMRAKDPVSIFISRKEAKLYVRQKMQPLFDAPVTFQQPDQPVGTHVFTAMAATEDDGMRWTVISIPSNLKRGGGHHPVADLRKGKHKAAPVVVERAPTVDPRTVLSRVVMPPDAVERISALFIPGSSIIVSDNKLSGETGEYTEFIVETP